MTSIGVRIGIAIILPALLSGCAALTAAPFVAADAIATPLTATPGDATRGKTIVISREGGHCILCHHVPAEEVKIFGNVAPALDGVGRRLTVAQLRQRVVDITAVNPDAVMPAFHRTGNLQRVARELRGQPVLSAQQVEDVVAWLASLKD